MLHIQKRKAFLTVCYLYCHFILFLGGRFNVQCVILFDCILKRHITNQGTLKILKIVHVFTISSLTYNEM